MICFLSFLSIFWKYPQSLQYIWDCYIKSELDGFMGMVLRKFDFVESIPIINRRTLLLPGSLQSGFLLSQISTPNCTQ